MLYKDNTLKALISYIICHVFWYMMRFFSWGLCPPTPHKRAPSNISSRCMWHSVSKHEKHEYEVVCSNHPIKYWMLEPTVSDQNYFKLFVHNLRDFLPTFLAISWKFTNSISGLNTLFWFQLFCSKLFSCFLYLVKRQFNFFLSSHWEIFSETWETIENA